MKIAIDGYEANSPQRLGSSQVGFNLIKYINKIDEKNDYTVLIPEAPLEDFPPERERFNYKILHPKRLWTYWTLPLFLYRNKNKYDVFFTPTHYIPRFAPCKRVVTIFDLSFIHFPESFTKIDLWKLSNLTKFSIKDANHIITISQFSKRDIINQYKVDKDKITVAYPGFNSNIFFPVDLPKIQPVLEKYHIRGNYIIYVGTIQPRKNLVRLMEAVSKIEGLNLVVVGKTTGPGRQGWMYEDILQAPKKLGIEQRVIFTGFVPNKDLAVLLNGAVAFIQPSLWEGFGIPVVEAMACGVPVIVSNVSSLPEIVGKAGLLIDPYSIDQIEQAIRTVIADKKLRSKLSKLGLKQSSKFSWQKMARVVLKALESI